MSEQVKDYPPYLDYPKPRKRQTNADRIRAMTDAELAIWIWKHDKKCKNDGFLSIQEYYDFLRKEVYDNG